MELICTGGGGGGKEPEYVLKITDHRERFTDIKFYPITDHMK